jgi:hypothetical protein
MYTGVLFRRSPGKEQRLCPLRWWKKWYQMSLRWEARTRQQVPPEKFPWNSFWRNCERRSSAGTLDRGPERSTRLALRGGVSAQVVTNSSAHHDFLLPSEELGHGRRSARPPFFPPSFNILRNSFVSCKRCRGTHLSILSFHRSSGHYLSLHRASLSTAVLPIAIRGFFARGSGAFYHRALCRQGCRRGSLIEARAPCGY